MSAYRENHVVAAVDGSKAATAAALWAADCAIRRGAALHLVHVCQTDVAAYPGQGMIPPDTRELAMEAGRSILIAARQAVTAAHPGLPVTAAAVPGAVVAELRDFAARALLTVLGTTGTGQLADVALGSVASRMVGRCGSPIVVVPWRPDGAPQSCDGPVVAGLDASADSDAALGFAFEEAAARHVSLVAVRSWDDKVLDRNLSSYPLAVDKAGVDAEEARMLAEQLAGWSEKYPDVVVQHHISRGSPVAALLAVAAGTHPVDPAAAAAPPAGLVVVGSRGRGPLTGLVLGSTSQALIAHAHCPVAVVRAGR